LVQDRADGDEFMISLTIDVFKGGVISDFLAVTLRVVNFVPKDIFSLFYRYEKP
jgi:hypothetical protein